MSEAESLKLPSCWTLTPVGELLKFKNGLNKGKAFFGHGTPIVNYMDVFNHTGLRAWDVQGLVDVNTAEKKAFSARRGDVLFTRTSETPEEVGISTVLLDELQDAVFSGFVLRGRPLNERLTPEFAQYCFGSRFVRDQIISSATYTTRALTNGRILSGIKLPLPDTLREQQAIAAALSDADGVVAGLERVIAKKRLIKQGAMQDLLTARRRLPGFSGEWEVTKLGEIARFGKGKGLPKSEILSAGTFECIHYGSLFREQPAVISEVQTYANGFNGAVFSDAGDVLMPTSDVTPSGLAVASCITKSDVILGGDILIIKPVHAALNGQFLSSVIRSSKTQIMELVSGTTVFHIYAGDMARFVLKMPSVAEQTAIAAVLSDMDAELQTLTTRLTKARAVKEGMMQALLTGRVRLV
jgi:type I restriction enzyme S subunit